MGTDRSLLSVTHGNPHVVVVFTIPQAKAVLGDAGDEGDLMAIGGVDVLDTVCVNYVVFCEEVVRGSAYVGRDV